MHMLTFCVLLCSLVSNLVLWICFYFWKKICSIKCVLLAFFLFFLVNVFNCKTDIYFPCTSVFILSLYTHIRFVSLLTHSLLMSYIYGAPSKDRNLT
jgi:hypothetical protein